MARLLLAALAEGEFALAGAGALVEHELTDRPTEDLDLFARSTLSVEEFDIALARAKAVLAEAGFAINELLSSERFARLEIAAPGKSGLRVDVGIDYRVLEPIHTDIGRILNRDDAVGNKVAALFSRGEPRDYLDVDRIRKSGVYSDSALLKLAADRDGGFTSDLFVWQLMQIRRIPASEVSPYETTPEQWQSVQERTVHWATVLAASSHGSTRINDPHSEATGVQGPSSSGGMTFPTLG